MTEDGLIRTASLVPPGAVALAYYRDNSPLAAIMGPVGSAKTTTTVSRIIRHAAEQGGIRRSRWVAVRETYRQLWGTTIRSWLKVIPKDMGDWIGGENQPATHVVPFHLQRYGRFELEMSFMAIGDQGIEEALRGVEMTGAWLNEMDTLQPDVVRFLRGRVGRYPGMADGGPTFSGILADFNAPDELNWVAEQVVYATDGVWKFFEQPPAVVDEGGRLAVNPAAENLRNLPPGYYRGQIQGNDESYVRRMLMNVPAASKQGKPVYERDWKPHFHVAKSELAPVDGLALDLGADAGRTPAVLIGQQLATGQGLVLDEIVEEGISGPEFAEIVLLHLRRRFPAWLEALERAKAGHVGAGEADQVIRAWADPASQYATESSPLSWMQQMTRGTGIRWRPAPVPGNDLRLRMDGMSHQLRLVPEPGQPGMLVDKRCKRFRQAMNSGYRFGVVRTGEGRVTEAPIKDKHSHIANAGEYLTAGWGAVDAAMGRRRRARGGPLPSRAETDDRPAEFERPGTGRAEAWSEADLD
jgi:hypothetical protein